MGHGIFLNSHKFNINTTIPVPPVIIDIPPVGTPLKDWTWEQISYVSQKGDARKYFNIGDTTTAIIRDNAGKEDTYAVRIIGFNQDTLINPTLYGNGTRTTAGITFETVGVLNNQYQLINYDNSTINIEIFFLPALYYNFICGGTQAFDPKTNKSIYTPQIRKNLKIYNEENNQDYQQDYETFDSFFMLSKEEYDSTQSEAYEYYLNPQNSLIKKNNSGNNCNYFTRSYDGRTYFSRQGSSDGVNWDTELFYEVDHLKYINRSGKFASDDTDTIHTDDYISLAFCV